MARKFLYVVATLIVLVIAGMFALKIWEEDLTRLAFVPSGAYEAQPALPDNAYADKAMWFALPGAPGPAGWRPGGMAAGDPVRAAVFFVHPTSYLAKTHWNDPLDDTTARETAERLIRANASAFNASDALWAPRYRQAAIGAFLTDKPEAGQAIDLAYADVLAAFDTFIADAPGDLPIVLAGHSQGALHVKRLLADRVAGTPLAARVAAVYAVGWPISIDHDLPKMGLPACTAPDQAGCVMSWLSYADPADTAMLADAYARTPALDGKLPGTSPFLCSNPLTGKTGGSAPASANLGTLMPQEEMDDATIEPGTVPATCGADHFLHIGKGPELGPFVLPGNNYHVYDVPLFWTNLRADFARRVAAWQAAR